MISHLWKRSRSGWNRNTKWTPLLLSQREFQRALAKERSRVDRAGGQFGVIILRLTLLSSLRKQTMQLSKVSRQRLRDTDEIGHLGPGRIGVMLPMTHAEGVELVMEDLLCRLHAAGVEVEGEGFCYPDDSKPTTGSKVGTAAAEEFDVNSATEEQLQREFEGTQPRLRSIPTSLFAAPYPAWKRAIDVTGACFGLAISAPVLLVFGALVKATSPGGALFCQKRTGYLGREFTIYKLRTMCEGAEQQRDELLEKNERDGPAFKLKSDPRVTTIGKFLRATGLDELPQLYNVLIGDMALVGPRPLPCFEAEQCTPWQRQRELIKPGLTCYWQVRKSEQIAFKQWMRLDLAYRRHQSFWVDTRLVLQTVASIVTGRVGH